MPDTKTELLEPETIHLKLTQLPRWRLGAGGTGLQRSWDVPSLWSGAAFASAVAAALESLGHTSATLAVTQEWVTVVVLNPGGEGVTEREFEVATRLEFGS